ncbi:hypothetical protein PIB30_095316 [Stylosanthes scabra]|uniref:Uncharacterized protein n=1 Tax=Stylosanthes scabra TaxID=79078 RepID=A0ABU6SW23_9FABA|nr:hypothetical protein [Stylosanthes scabra]
MVACPIKGRGPQRKTKTEQGMTAKAETRTEPWKVRTSSRRFDGELPKPRTAPPRVEAMDLDLRTSDEFDLPLYLIICVCTSQGVELIEKDEGNTQIGAGSAIRKPDGLGGDELSASTVVTGGGVTDVTP